MSKIKQIKLTQKINKIIEFEELEERLEMSSLSVLGCSYAYLPNGNTIRWQ